MKSAAHCSFEFKDRDVFIDIEHVGKQACCPKTFDLCGVYDRAPKRKWRHLDILDYKTYLVCRLPRVKNKQGKVITVKPPWGGSGVSFSSQFEEKVIDLLQATKNQTKTALLVWSIGLCIIRWNVVWDSVPKN